MTTTYEKRIHLLLAYASGPGRNLSQAKKAIAHNVNKEYSMGRVITPQTQILQELGWIKRINPGSSKAQGYIFKTTAEGLEQVEHYFSSLKNISEAYPHFGF